MTRDEEELQRRREATMNEGKMSQAIEEVQRNLNFQSRSWRRERRAKITKAFDTIGFPKEQRQFEYRKEFESAYRKFLLRNRPAAATSADYNDQFCEISGMKEEIHTYMGWFGKDLEALRSWEAMDEKSRPAASTLQGARRLQLAMALEGLPATSRAQTFGPSSSSTDKPMSKPKRSSTGDDKHSKGWGWFKRR